MAMTTSTTRPTVQQEHVTNDIETYEPFRLSAVLFMTLTGLVVLAAAFAIDGAHAVIALSAVVVIWLSGTIR